MNHRYWMTNAHGGDIYERYISHLTGAELFFSPEDNHAYTRDELPKTLKPVSVVPFNGTQVPSRLMDAEIDREEHLIDA